jgi:hypothetical protein
MPISAPSARPELDSRIQRIVREAAAGSSRSMQRAIGPSEIGEECERRLVYKLMDMDESNTTGDPWPSIVGTATHVWLADAFRAENERLGWDRYLVERRVHMTDGISGTCDLFDATTKTVIDHKVLGTTSLSKVKKEGPSERYRVQLHLYAYGYDREDIDVDAVALACYPRGGWLDGLYTWTEPYRPEVAEAALDRLAKWTQVAYLLDLENHPERWSMVAPKSGPGCTFCPWWTPGKAVTEHGCPGPT